MRMTRSTEVYGSLPVLLARSIAVCLCLPLPNHFVSRTVMDNLPKDGALLGPCSGVELISSCTTTLLPNESLGLT